MKIAQVAPLMESVPPRLYGGTERIVSYVTEELVEQGHDVTLFASGDSLTRARLVPCTAKALRLSDVKDPIPYHLIMLDEVRRLAASFDVLHFHVDLLHYPVIRDFSWRTVTTLHGRLDLPDMHPLYRTFNEAPLVSISDNQRKPMPPVNWAGRIHHGLPQNLLKPLASRSGDYLAFLGRISPEKRPDRAIEIAARSGRELRIAAKIDKVDRDYWRHGRNPGRLQDADRPSRRHDLARRLPQSPHAELRRAGNCQRTSGRAHLGRVQVVDQIGTGQGRPPVCRKWRLGPVPAQRDPRRAHRS
jgi:glycosyltransferase involved in cell wall biosynthesis